MLSGLRASSLQALFVAGLIAATSLTAASAAPSSPPQKTSPAQKAQVVENYAKLPLGFEANTGQAGENVKFLSRGSGYGLYLTGNEAMLTVRKTAYSAARPGLQGKLRSIQKSAPSDVVRMRLAGASGKAEPLGEELLPGTANYFIGNDPAKWHTRVPTYAKVRYTGIYPGIDLVYYGDQRQLEFDFVVAPNGNPRSIRLRFCAADGLHLTANGDLLVTTASGALAFHKPLVYQNLDGRRHPIAGDFAVLGKHTVGFRVGSYDRAKALVIDPALAYSTFLGGSGLGIEGGNAIAVDTAGNVYVAGLTRATDFPVTSGAYQTTNRAAAIPAFNAFVTKLNPTGTALLYSSYLGGSGTGFGGDTASAISVDAAGNVYVTGQAYSTDFPVTAGAFQTTNRAAANTSGNAFVTKLNATGAALLYSTYLGGSSLPANPAASGDRANAIAVDAAGDAYVAGLTFSDDFPVTAGAYQLSNKAAAVKLSNAFVTELNPVGTALVYSTYLGGSGGQGFYGAETANAIVVDTAGNAYVTGETSSPDFPITPGAFQTTNKAVANDTNAFVAKLNPTGAALVYSTYLGGSIGDIGNAIALDAAGNVYVAGQTTSTDFPVTPGAFQTTNQGAGNQINLPNAFITKLNPDGTALVYSTYLGGSGGAVNVMPTLGFLAGDQARGLAIDSFGNVYVTGATASANFPVTKDAFQTTNHDQPGCVGSCIGGYNAFMTELNPSGGALVYSTYLGGSGINPLDFYGLLEFGEGDQASALAIDDSGNVYVTGTAVSYDFPVTAGAFQTTVKSPFGNSFLSKLDISATSTTSTPTVTVTPNASTITSAQPLTVTVAISGGSGSPTPTGTVTLASGTYISAATPLSSGGATINISGGSLLPEPPMFPTPDVLIAKYVPDEASSSKYNSSSGVASVNVFAAYLSVTPSSSTLTWAQSQSQALTVSIAATGGAGDPVPTGTVTLTTGSYSSTATALSGGGATITIPPATLTTGFNALNVSYSGDSNYAAERIGGSALMTVGSVTVSVVPSSSTVNSTQALQVTITVSAGSGSPMPTGMVTLICGSYTSATTLLAGGSATITIPAGSLPPGLDILEVSYGSGYYPGASGQASVTVTGPSFTITGTAVTLKAGSTTGNTSTITVTPAGGFTGSVALTAVVTSSPSGAQEPPTLSFGSTSPVSITSTAAGTATLTISTAGNGGCSEVYPMPGGILWYIGGGAVLACVLFFCLPARQRKWRTAFATLALLVTLMAGLIACGGGGVHCVAITPGTTAGTYTVTVTGTSGSTTATGTLTLTVQ